LVRSIRAKPDYVHVTCDATRLFFHSCDRMLVRAVTVQGWADAQKEFESVAEIVAVIALESVGAVINRKLRAETNVETVAV
jgi:hypothetical protein